MQENIEINQDYLIYSHLICYLHFDTVKKNIKYILYMERDISIYIYIYICAYVCVYIYTELSLKTFLNNGRRDT